MSSWATRDIGGRPFGGFRRTNMSPMLWSAPGWKPLTLPIWVTFGF
jgi:hypothetical protein